jgi:hypothetical protein
VHLFALFLSGQVVTLDGRPVANASVNASWKAWPAPGSVKGVTDVQGRYELTIKFDALSGESSLGDKCEGTLASTVISISLEGKVIAKREVPMANTQHGERITVPTVKVRLPPNTSLERSRER